jgi:hypothetical protein
MSSSSVYSNKYHHDFKKLIQDILQQKLYSKIILLDFKYN